MSEQTTGVVFMCQMGKDRSESLAYELGLDEEGYIEGGIHGFMKDFRKLKSDNDRINLVKETFNPGEKVIFVLRRDERGDGYTTLKKYMDSAGIDSQLVETKDDAIDLFHKYTRRS